MSLLADQLRIFEDSRNAIFAYFGYVENWRAFPLEDRTDEYWMLIDEHVVVWSPEPFTSATIREGAVIYSGHVYTQRHLSKWVYRGPDYTMILVDTHCDMNVLLMVFKNSLECANGALKDLHEDSW